MRATRAAIVDRPARSQVIWTNLIESLEPRGVAGAHVLAFVGVGTEPDTSSLIPALWRLGATVYLPRVVRDEIVAVRHDVDEPMELGAYGIPSPVGDPVDPSVIDIVVVPGLAFTRDGQRLGQGGGYYDRYLARVRAHCTTVGVCFREQIVSAVPAEIHDQRVSRVVTDQGCIDAVSQ